MKKIFLLVLLGIPVLLAVVLKFFGDSQYEIPVYYENGVSSVNCDIDISGQYYVYLPGQDDWEGNINILFFYTGENEYAERSVVELSRMAQTKEEIEMLKIYALGSAGFGGSLPDHAGDINEWGYDFKELEKIAKCDLLIPESEIIKEDEVKSKSVFEIIVLLDRQGRIRGYFDSAEQDEFDRLSAETDILDIETKTPG